MRRLAGAVVALAAVVAGCGVGAGETPDEVRLTVTDGFGTRTLLERPDPEVDGADTVMRLLQRNAKVETKYGGGFVQAIDGMAGGREDGRPLDWFYYVNGVLADEGAASTDVRAGDRVWWDRRDWGVTNTVPAVVGSFPEPFVHGVDGERLPTRVECAESVRDACEAVQQRFTDLGIVTGRTTLGTPGGTEVLRVRVGPWAEVRGEAALRAIEDGPKASGVYARFDARGRVLEALDPRGRVVRRLRAGTGLIVATRNREDAPMWAVTGTDAAGVRAAAGAFEEGVLGEKFALAVSDGAGVALPVVSP